MKETIYQVKLRVRELSEAKSEAGRNPMGVHLSLIQVYIT